jgi:hypothetical protein
LISLYQKFATPISFLYTGIDMKIFDRIRKNPKAILIAFVLVFNIPLAFGLIDHVSSAPVDDYYNPLLYNPGQQNLFGIADPAVTRMLTRGECDGATPTGSIIGGIRFFEKITVDSNFSQMKCLEDAGKRNDVAHYFDNNSGGLVNMVSNFQATILEQRPMSAKYFVDQKVYALSNPGTVYASGAPDPYFPSGTGYQLLQPVQAFWGWSVNVVYGFLVLIIIGIAFAIIFRNNLGGAQSVTIQSAIPSIALAMILVPMSYAISGVFIDAITVGTNAVHAFLLGPGAPGHSVYLEREPNRDNGDCPENATGDDSCDRGLYADDSRVEWMHIQKMVDVSDEVSGAVSTLPDPLDENRGPLVTNWFIFDIVKIILDLFTGKNKSESYWVGEIINVLIGITMIWIGIKIAVKLFQKYMMLILMPILSPFIFATVAIPGNGMKSVIEYVKMLASGSLFFIVTYAMFLLTVIFTSTSFSATIKTGVFVPPLLGFKDIFVATGGEAGGAELTTFLFALVGLGIYFSIPKTLENIDNALGIPNSIPAFITTPLQSFRESANVSFRAIQTGTRGISNVERFSRTAPYQVERSIRNRLDKRLGLSPGEPGTWEAKKSTELATERANAQRDRQRAIQAGDWGGVRAANKRIENLEAQSKKYGVSVGYAEKDKKPKLEAVFKYANGSPDNTIMFDQNERADYIRRGPYVEEIKKAKVVLSTQNLILPNPIILQVALVSQIPGTSEEEFDRTKLLLTIDGTVPPGGDIIPGPVPALPGGVFDVPRGPGFPSTFVIWDNRTAPAVYQPNNIYTTYVALKINNGIIYSPTGDGDKFEIPMDLIIHRADILFGNPPHDPLISNTQPLLSLKFAFAIGNTDSNVIRVTMGQTTR